MSFGDGENRVENRYRDEVRKLRLLLLLVIKVKDSFGNKGIYHKNIAPLVEVLWNDKKPHKNMSSFTLLDLASRAKNPDFYDKSRDMETALSWNAVQGTLKDMGRGELSKYITSIRLTDKNIVITTGKPIANAEIKIYSEQILSRLNTSLGQIKIFPREKVIFK